MEINIEQLPPGDKCHLNRYITFINSRKDNQFLNNKYIEEHHIIPKSMGGNNNSNNLIKLTSREHFIAHLMLWKCYGGKMANAFWFFSHINPSRSEVYFRLTSRQYEKLRIACRKETSKRCKNSIFISKENECKRIFLEELNYYLNLGWVKGRLNIRENHNLGKHSKNSFWVHKDDENKMIHINELECYLNNGWIKGRNQKYSIEYRKKLATSKGMKQIHMRNKKKYCKPEELELYFSQGWVAGWGKKIGFNYEN
jgi:hypothetical protein